MHQPIRSVAGLAIFILFLSSCSGASLPTSPGTLPLETSGIQVSETHQIWGVWEVTVDYNGIRVEEISDRYLAGHFNVKSFLRPPHCDDCIKFTNIVYDQVNNLLGADVTLKNPTLYIGADVRGTVISNNPEVYLMDPDDFTELFDTDTPPDKNPFRLFGQDDPSGWVLGNSEVTETFILHYDSIPFAFQSVVDAVYPPTSNREPYIISSQTIEGSLDEGGNVTRKLEVKVLDRHEDDLNVNLSCEDLDWDIDMVPKTGAADWYTANVSNTNNAAVGEYEVLISADDGTTQWTLYDYITVTVLEQVEGWYIDIYDFPSEGCSRDVAAAFDVQLIETNNYFCGGDMCDFIKSSNIDFSNTAEFFSLTDIDPLVPDMNPYPVGVLDSSIAGGIGFFSNSEMSYSDPFYFGPMNSLLFTIYMSPGDPPKYINYGDGDSGRIPPSSGMLIGVDVSGDVLGNLYGMWASVKPGQSPEFYGLTPDFTRHDVFMGGALGQDMVGSGPGLLSADPEVLDALAVDTKAANSGRFLILENEEGVSEIEIIEYFVEFTTQTTLFNMSNTLNFEVDSALDIDIMRVESHYSLNPDQTTLVILMKSTGGGYVKLYNAETLQFLENIGDAAHPIIPGTPARLDVNQGEWKIVVTNEEDNAAVIKYIY